MCCIFTCCGWLIDLLQRLWTFTMSCLISFAVCCSLMTASMSGIALGYNYSIAEYIDLKETNVSVYLKRGIFDDEAKDDMSWRRAGHLPVAGHIADSNLLTAAPDEESSPMESRRRLENSIYESDNANKFEGALLKLTAKAPDSSTTTRGYTSDLEMSEIVEKYPHGSIEQLKAIQTLINKRKHANALQQEIGSRRRFDGRTEKYPSIQDIDLPNVAAVADNMVDNQRLGDPDYKPNFLRLAVPDETIGLKSNWMLPKYQNLRPENSPHFTYPSPVTPRPGVVRTTRPRFETKQTVSRMVTRTELISSVKEEPAIPKSIDEEIDSFKERLLLDKYSVNEMKEEDYLKKNKGKKYDVDDYEDEIKGLPVRRRRNIKKEVAIKEIASYKDYNKTANTSTLEVNGESGVKHFSTLLIKLPTKSFDNTSANIINTTSTEKSIINTEVKREKNITLDDVKSIVLDVESSTSKLILRIVSAIA